MPTRLGLGRALRATTRVCILCAVLVGLALSPAGAVRADPTPSSSRVILQLDEPALAEGAVDARSGERLAQVEAQQASVVAQLAAIVPGAQVERSYHALFNGLVVRLPSSDSRDLADLARLPGVRGVYEDEPHYLALYASLPAIHAEPLWTQLGGASVAGAGVRIAVVDSGVDPAHPMFEPGGLSYPSGFPRGDARYTSAKVIAARTYWRPGDPPLPGEDTPIPGPLGSDHGTQLSGVAAGAQVTATLRGLNQAISGVAPAAWLMNYRVFYPSESTGAGREVAYTAELLQAIEDAVTDGADVLLMGWSSASDRLPLESPISVALDAAIAAGCIIVAPAGNEGPGLGSASRLPGGMERAITVGMVSKDQVLAYDLVDVTAPTPVPDHMRGALFARALYGAQLSSPLGPFPYEDAGEACDPLPNSSLQGRVALVTRDGCPFADKTYHAQEAGAVAVIVVNSDQGITQMACGGAHCEPGELTIPTVMVSQSYGELLHNWLGVHGNDAELRLDPNARVMEAVAGVVHPNSGAGPAFARTLKPDLAAPGVDVLSAARVGYAQATGSSIAAAHVAGAAALLRQAHPGWGHDEVKSALMSTARADGLALDEARTEPAGLLQRGAGLVDLAQAADVPVIATPPSFSFPGVLAGGSYERTLTLRDARTTGAVRTYTIAWEGAGALSLAAVGPVTLGPGETVTATIRMQIAPGAAPEDYQGAVSLSGEGVTLRLPVWAHVDPQQLAADVLLIDNDFSQFESYVDYAPYVSRALADAGYSYQVWDADLGWGSPQTVPPLETLQQFDTVIWITGDNVHPDGTFVPSTPLTKVDMQVLGAYLDAGGRLLAMGQNLADASDVNPDPDPTWGRAEFLHYYLGAHWLRSGLFSATAGEILPPNRQTAVAGVPGGFLANVALDLGGVGDGAHNQRSVDEIAPGGLRDGGDLDLVRPVLHAVGGYPVASGYVGVAKSAEPTLEDPSPAIGYRTTYYAFGLEGVNNEGTTSREDLLARTLAWLRDAVSVSIEDAVSAPQVPTVLRCSAASSVGSPIVAYRWRVGEGATARMYSSSVPQITVTFQEAGIYPVGVEVTDALGHKAVASASLQIAHGGTSTLSASAAYAPPGGSLTLTTVLRNTTGEPQAFDLTLPLPAGTQYVAHSEGSFEAGALHWAGSVPANAEHLVTLEVAVLDSVRAGDLIIATAEFEVAGEEFSRSVSVRVGWPAHLPSIAR